MPWPQKTAQPFVTISRESGSGGTSLARALVRHLNVKTAENVFWNVFDGNLISTMLKSNHLSSRIARFLPEDKVPEINASVGELVGLHPSLWELTEKTKETMRRLAQTGNAILVGRGSNFATADIPHGVHVRLIASAEHRARYLSHLYQMPFNEALAYNAKRDAARRRYVKSTFNADVSDPAAYDLVINTERITLNEAVEQVAALVCSRAET